MPFNSTFEYYTDPIHQPATLILKRENYFIRAELMTIVQFLVVNEQIRTTAILNIWWRLFCVTTLVRNWLRITLDSLSTYKAKRLAA